MSSFRPPTTARPDDTTAVRQTVVVIALLAIVIALDQATKWWGWRHVDGSFINRGSDMLTGPRVDAWYSDPFTGSVLDLFGVGFLSSSTFLLVRRRRPVVVLLSAALVIGGWSSNQLDRIGFHSWTAPGSVRGAVDFIAFSHYRYNLADLVIVAATLVLGLAMACLTTTALYRRLRTARQIALQRRSVIASMSRGAASRNAVRPHR
jgi:lipoprotein signal peptidase